MSVLIETSLGDLVVDLDTENCPKTCENFIKLSKAYRYNYITFFSVQKNFIAQTGDPTNDGQGGSSIWSMLDPNAPRYSSETYFAPERNERTMRHNVRGTISMACKRRKGRQNKGDGEEDEGDDVVAGSQFFVTLADHLDELDNSHAPFGRIVEGNEKDGTLDKINAAFVDQRMRPLRDIRIEHVVVLDDPFEDPAGLTIPSRTPSPTPEQLAPIGLDASAPLQDDQDRPEEEIEEERRKRNTNAAALTLEMVGDLPFAEVRPPENILFVCKLNPITQSEDLELIFSRFGKILTCEVVKDRRTGDSLQYAFIEFDEQKSAEQAYFKMQNVLVDDRRIWVDFSQSVSKLSGSWNAGRAGGKPLKVTNGRNYEGGRDDGRRLNPPSASSSSRGDRSSYHHSGAERRHRDRYDSREKRAHDSGRYDRSPRRASDRDVDRDRRSTDGRRREEKREYSTSRRDDRHHHRRRTPSPVERRRDRR